VGGVDHVVTDGGRCGVALKSYGGLLDTVQARAFSSLAQDVHELLAQAPLRSALAPLALRVVLHDACQLRHGQRLPDLGRALLAQIPGLELIELDPQAGACCGAPGIYRLTQPEASVELGDRQARAIAAAGADILVTADAACGEQLAEHLRGIGHRIDVRHPIELIARSIEAARGA
jgi:glycolate oxidase iron-sulfur subunit